jgi:integrase
MSDYLKKESGRNVWQARLDIPIRLRPNFGGKRVLVKSLGTTDRKEARHRAAVAVAVWREQFKRATSVRERRVIEEEIDDKAYWIGAGNVDQGVSPYTDPEAGQFYFAAMGHGLTDYLDEWIAQLRTTAKTKAMRASDVRRFAASFKTVEDVTRPAVKRWVTVLQNDLARGTITRVLAGLRSYWRFLQSLNVAKENDEPFSRLDVARQGQQTEQRQPFEPADVVKLLRLAEERGDTALADLIRLAMWSGARVAELCSLTAANVKADYFDIVSSKTAAGRRQVPIAPALMPTIQRLAHEAGQRADDPYIIGGQSANRYGDRSGKLGLRFSRLKAAAGYGPAFVFHSIRKTVATLLQNSGSVPEFVAASILGHEWPTMTFGTYAGSVSMDEKRKAIEKLAYPD